MTIEEHAGAAPPSRPSRRTWTVAGGIGFGLVLIGAGIGIGAAIWSGGSTSKPVAAPTNAAPSATGSGGASTAGPAGLDITREINQGTGQASVACPGDHPYITGGGGQDNVGGNLDVNAPNTRVSPNNWTIQSTNSNDPLVVFALCSK